MDKQILDFTKRFDGADAYIVGKVLEVLSIYAECHDYGYIDMAREYLKTIVDYRVVDYKPVDDSEEHCTCSTCDEEGRRDCSTCVYQSVPGDHEPCVGCVNSYGTENRWSNHDGCMGCKHWEDETYCIDCKGTKLHHTKEYEEAKDYWEEDTENDKP